MRKTLRGRRPSKPASKQPEQQASQQAKHNGKKQRAKQRTTDRLRLLLPAIPRGPQLLLSMSFAKHCTAIAWLSVFLLRPPAAALDSNSYCAFVYVTYPFHQHPNRLSGKIAIKTGIKTMSSILPASTWHTGKIANVIMIKAKT